MDVIWKPLRLVGNHDKDFQVAPDGDRAAAVVVKKAPTGVSIGRCGRNIRCQLELDFHLLPTYNTRGSEREKLRYVRMNENGIGK